MNERGGDPATTTEIEPIPDLRPARARSSPPGAPASQRLTIEGVDYFGRVVTEVVHLPGDGTTVSTTTRFASMNPADALSPSVDPAGVEWARLDIA